MTRPLSIPAFSACHFTVPELPTHSELARMNVSVSPDSESRIRAAAAATVICRHPEADDCFNVSGMGRSRREAYCEMLEDLYFHCSDRFDDDAEADAFYDRIKAAQAGALND